MKEKNNEAEVLAQAGVRAEPYAYEEDDGCDMKLVYAEWFRLGMGKMEPDCTYRPLYLAAPTTPAQVPAAEVRAQALSEVEHTLSLCRSYVENRLDEGTRERNPIITDAANGVLERIEEDIAAIRALAQSSTADKASEVRAAEDAPLNGIPATMMHDEGAIARCFYCGRYSLDRATLGPDSRQPVCECGKQHGWSGSFKKPDANALWSGAAPSTADSGNTSALGEGADRA